MQERVPCDTIKYTLQQYQSTMGVQNEIGNLSSESFVVIVAVLIGKSVRYLNSIVFAIVRAIGLFPLTRFDSDDYSDGVGSGLAEVILLSEQLNLNRACSYAVRSDGCDDRFGSDCVVCLSRMREGENVRRLVCGHVFHKDCFDGWLRHLNFNCPLCRTPLMTDERESCTRRRVASDLLA